MKVPATRYYAFVFLKCSLIGQEVQGLPCVQRYVPRYKVQQAGASDAGRHDAYRNSSHRGVAWDILTGTFLLLMIYNLPTTKPPMTDTLLQPRHSQQAQISPAALPTNPRASIPPSPRPFESTTSSGDPFRSSAPLLDPT